MSASKVRLELDLGTIGRVSLEGEDAREVIKGLAFWQSLPATCPSCESGTRLVYDRVKSQKAETYGREFDYYRLRCLGDPQHEVSLGVYQDGSGLYYPESKEWTERVRHTDDGEPQEPRREEPKRQQPVARRGQEPLATDEQLSAIAALLKPLKLDRDTVRMIVESHFDRELVNGAKSLTQREAAIVAKWTADQWSEKADSFRVPGEARS